MALWAWTLIRRLVQEGLESGLFGGDAMDVVDHFRLLGVVLFQSVDVEVHGDWGGVDLGEDGSRLGVLDVDVGVEDTRELNGGDDWLRTRRPALGSGHSTDHQITFDILGNF